MDFPVKIRSSRTSANRGGGLCDAADFSTVPADDGAPNVFSIAIELTDNGATLAGPTGSVTVDERVKASDQNASSVGLIFISLKSEVQNME